MKKAPKAPLFRSVKTAAIAALLQHEQLSRSELASITGVSAGAITELSHNLLEQGLLVEHLSPPPTGLRGRPSIQLSFKGSHSYFVGISIGELSSSLAIADLQGNLLVQQPIAGFTTPAQFIAEVKRSVSAALKQARIPRASVRGVGISITGIVDSNAGVCRYSAALNWQDVPIAKMITQALNLPAWVDNDANAAAVGEKLFGHAREFSHFTTVVLSHLIGSAHYMNGMLYRGYDGGAGEIGHIIVDPNGIACYCGRQGCLETVAGGSALRHAAKKSKLAITEIKDLEALAMQGNTVATQLLRMAGTALGTAIATLVHINNPQCVLFVDLEGFGNGVFRTATRQAIENNILPRFLGSTRITFIHANEGYLPRSAASIAAFEYLTSL